MGLFGSLYKSMKKTIKLSFYGGVLYNILGYFYVKQIDYRLGDQQQITKLVNKEMEQSLQEKGHKINENQLFFASILIRGYHFYNKIWYYREYQQLCKKYHKNVVKCILKNYQQYGIFDKSTELKDNIKKRQLNQTVTLQILAVRQLNMKIKDKESNIKDSIQLIKLQKNICTGNIIGLDKKQQQRIDLIFDYFMLGKSSALGSENAVFTRYHNYGDTVFKLLQI